MSILFLKPTSKSERTSHILAMGNRTYGDMSLFCASTFRMHNSNFQILIHCDLDMFEYLRSKFAVRFGKIKLCQCVEIGTNPYKKQLEFFGNLQGTYDLLMDADIWWKSSLPNVQVPLTYNIESFLRSFELIEIGKSLSQDFNFGNSLKMNLMITGCLTSWNGSYTNFETHKMLKFFENMESSSKFRNLTRESEIRLIGQIIMSIVFGELAKFENLVSLEKNFKKTILKSSFYGATGFNYGK